MPLLRNWTGVLYILSLVRKVSDVGVKLTQFQSIEVVHPPMSPMFIPPSIPELPMSILLDLVDVIKVDEKVRRGREWEF